MTALRRSCDRQLSRLLDRLWILWCRFRHYGDPLELLWDHRLRIRTTGRDSRRESRDRHAYEPTPYRVLRRIQDSGTIGKGDVLLDYGAGKGRVDFFFSGVCGIRSIGVEYDTAILSQAEQNKKTAHRGKRVSFVSQDARDYRVPAEVNRIFFFNPFSKRLLQEVLEQIYASCDENPREMLLYFYYPTVDYMELLLCEERLTLYGEIETQDLYPTDSQEAVLVFQLARDRKEAEES